MEKKRGKLFTLRVLSQTQKFLSAKEGTVFSDRLLLTEDGTKMKIFTVPILT
jgi:hypothetical protein